MLAKTVFCTTVSTFAGSPALWLSRSQLNFLLTNLTQVRLFRFVSLGSSLSVRLSLCSIVRLRLECLRFACFDFVFCASHSTPGIHSQICCSLSFTHAAIVSRACEWDAAMQPVTGNGNTMLRAGKGKREWGHAENLDTHSASPHCSVRCLRPFAAVNCWLISAPNWWVWLVAEGSGQQQLRLRLRNTSLAPIGCRHCRRRRVVRWV